MILPYSHDKGKPDPFEYLEVTTSETVAIGEALKLASGKLTKAGLDSDSGAPEFIAMEPVTSAPAGTVIAVIRVSDDTVYETELSVDSASIAVGAKYTLASGADSITATTTKGIAEVIAYDGKTAGDKVRIRF